MKEGKGEGTDKNEREKMTRGGDGGDRQTKRKHLICKTTNEKLRRTKELTKYIWRLGEVFSSIALSHLKVERNYLEAHESKLSL